MANKEHHYACDLGLGGTPIDVGTADEIWSGHPSLSEADYLKALNESLAKQGKPAVKAADAKTGYKDALTLLKKTFDDADRRWSEWVPLKADGSKL